MFRNNHIEAYEQVVGGWNFVFVGNDGAPATTCTNDYNGVHYTTAD